MVLPREAELALGYASLRTRGTTLANPGPCQWPHRACSHLRATPRVVVRLVITPDASWRSRQFISLIRWTVQLLCHTWVHLELLCRPVSDDRLGGAAGFAISARYGNDHGTGT